MHEAIQNPATMPQPRCAEIEIDGERLGYALYECDVRSDEQRQRDAARGALAGDLIIIIPGHGQTADSALHLIHTSAQHSKSGVAWCVDIDPPAGGDPVKARAMPLIIRRHLPALLASGAPAAEATAGAAQQVTLFGWSHGGAEALRTAEAAPELIPHVVGLCPAGLIQRSVFELLVSFLIESIHLVLVALKRGDPAYLRIILSFGANIAQGIYGDVRRTHSVSRAWQDICWTARKASGLHYSYTGTVGILFGAQDRVIRWRDVFPNCREAGEVGRWTPQLQAADFPCVTELQVEALPGNHLSPETDAVFGLTALRLAGQLLAP
jgi:pimeloyl-ACP methyl ester carboxylesterase